MKDKLPAPTDRPVDGQACMICDSTTPPLTPVTISGHDGPLAVCVSHAGEDDGSRWGDPSAPFPYCLTREQYEAEMKEVHRYGLTDEQFAGRACVYCGTVLVARVKVGLVSRQDVFACRLCSRQHAHPAWCDLRHPPFVPGSTWLDLREHEGGIGEMATSVPGERGSITVDITATAHPDDESMSNPYAVMYVGDGSVALTAADLRRLASLTMDAADRLDEVNGDRRH